MCCRGFVCGCGVGSVVDVVVGDLEVRLWDFARAARLASHVDVLPLLCISPAS
jgi:hypothetical protein